MIERRLRDDKESPDADRAFLARLVDSQDRYAPSDERRRRVKERIAAGPRGAAPRWAAPAALVAVTAALVIAGLLARTSRTGSTSVADAPDIAARSPPAPDAHTQRAPAAQPSVHDRDAPRAPEPSAPQPASPRSPPEPARPASAEPFTDEPTPARRAAPRPRPPSSSATPRALVDGDEWRVVSAARALRREKAPARAAQLLDDYLTLSPDGPLAEEALALSIEAALALGDTKAPALGARYLARYPSGRFSEVARRAQRARP